MKTYKEIITHRCGHVIEWEYRTEQNKIVQSSIVCPFCKPNFGEDSSWVYCYVMEGTAISYKLIK